MASRLAHLRHALEVRAQGADCPAPQWSATIGSDRNELDGNPQTPNQELVFIGSGVKKGGGAVQFTVNIAGSILAGSNLAVIGYQIPGRPPR